MLTQSSSLRFWLGSVLVKTRSPFPVNSLKRSLQNGTNCASVPLISWVTANIINSARVEEAMICDRGLSSWNEFLKSGSSQLDDHDSLASSFYSTRASDRSCITWAGRARTRTSSRATFPESKLISIHDCRDRHDDRKLHNIDTCNCKTYLTTTYYCQTKYYSINLDIKQSRMLNWMQIPRSRIE